MSTNFGPPPSPQPQPGAPGFQQPATAQPAQPALPQSGGTYDNLLSLSGEQQTPAPQANPGTGGRMSGYEVADKIASGAEKTADVVGTVFIKLYAVILIAAGIFLLVIAGGDIWWAAGLVLLYGIYLIFPGDKWVIY